MKKFLVLIALLAIGFSSYAQSVNEYAYVIVPKHYDFLKDDDQFQLNGLTKFLFEKYGFKAYMEGLGTPAEVAADQCNSLYANVLEEEGFIRTKLQVELKDCNGKVIYLSQVGDSKNKDYGRAYHEALREAFRSIEELNYKYIPKQKDVAAAITKEEAPKAKKHIVITTKQNEPVEVPEVTETSSVHTIEVTEVTEMDTLPLTEIIYKSDVSSYSVVFKNEVYSIFDGDKNIGKAVLVEQDQFKVTTSEFEGTAVLKGDTFVIERQIKGVSGKVQMIFVKE